jgi:hypothetical protein
MRRFVGLREGEGTGMLAAWVLSRHEKEIITIFCWAAGPWFGQLCFPKI